MGKSVMRRYELKIKQYDTYCELCNGHHEYIPCPLCNGEILMVYEGDIADCGEGHSFSVWSKKWREKRTVIIECELILTGKFGKAECGEKGRWDLIAQGSHDDLLCCEEECPLVESISA